jgi:hypothetical protein
MVSTYFLVSEISDAVGMKHRLRNSNRFLVGKNSLGGMVVTKFTAISGSILFIDTKIMQFFY